MTVFPLSPLSRRAARGLAVGRSAELASHSARGPLTGHLPAPGSFVLLLAPCVPSFGPSLIASISTSMLFVVLAWGRRMTSISYWQPPRELAPSLSLGMLGWDITCHCVLWLLAPGRPCREGWSLFSRTRPRGAHRIGLGLEPHREHPELLSAPSSSLASLYCHPGF